MNILNQTKVFDAHFHIIDDRFPLNSNNGYLPDIFTVDQYRGRMKAYNLCGGVVVSGSFQSFDQTYLVDAIQKLGSGFFGVTQLPSTVSNQELISLNKSGVKGIRFNLKRGGSESIDQLERMANRVFELVGWHVELYVDSTKLENLFRILINLPSVSIDHLGLSKEGLPTLVKLAEKNVRVKASGFSRVNFDTGKALSSLYSANPTSLIFGTDLPSTRAPHPYRDQDYQLIIDTLDEQAAKKVLFENAEIFYRTD
jgi:predicted TIM-barrel fold metal-dependent hydrolase